MNYRESWLYKLVDKLWWGAFGSILATAPEFIWKNLGVAVQNEAGTEGRLTIYGLVWGTTALISLPLFKFGKLASDRGWVKYSHGAAIAQYLLVATAYWGTFIFKTNQYEANLARQSKPTTRLAPLPPDWEYAHPLMAPHCAFAPTSVDLSPENRNNISLALRQRLTFGQPPADDEFTHTLVSLGGNKYLCVHRSK